MSGWRALAALALAAAALAVATPAAPLASATGELEATHAAQAEAARRYRESLAALLPLQAAARQRAASEVERLRALHAQGLVAAADVEAAVRALAEARQAADRTRGAIGEADALVVEA